MSRWIGISAVAWVANVGVAQQDGALAVALREQLGRQTDTAARPIERDALARMYGPVARPRWLTASAQLTRQAEEAIDVLASVDRYGLPVQPAEVERLKAFAGSRNSPDSAARFDVELSRMMIRFVANVRTGRISPAAVGLDLPNAHEDVDLASLVDSVANSPEVASTVAIIEPKYAGYRALQRALLRYRTLAADTTVRPPQRPGSTIRPGATYHDTRALARFLRALGDLPALDTISAVYEGALVEAVRGFQRRHGLDPDGVIGPATAQALRTPLSYRVRQIELGLERWRWLPNRPPNRFVAVNVPGFRLDAFENDSMAEHPALVTNVVVGQAQGHKTPMFTATMREVVFLPYWDVPTTIARTELVPLFRRRPGYFTSEGFEIVRTGTSDVEAPTFPPTPANLARVASGSLRVRQRPGPANALGFVKFVFPNRYNVFLHDTPTRDLFARSRRDFSHGCIRVARPNELAQFVLRGQPQWDAIAIDSAMQGDHTIHVPLSRPLPVYVLYATAVAACDGTVSFYPDLYQHDATLERRLGLAPITRP